jgi:S1-C subfamily serine protease
MRNNALSPFKLTFLMITLFMLAALACQFGRAVETIPTPEPPPVVAEPEPVVAEPEAPAEPAEPEQPAEPEEETAPPLPVVEARVITIEDLQAATVQILAKQMVSGRLRTVWTGSGTIISAEGLILTNAHVTNPGAPGLATLYQDPSLLFAEDPDVLVVAINEAADRPPVESYIAEVVALDGPLDLAIIRITADINNNRLHGASLDLPYIDLGNSNTIRLGDEIRVLGYPGAGGQTITFTRGNVSGFESQPLVGDRAWIKTDTTFSPGNSGGLGVNEQGELIGVPSFVQDAIGGAINRLRAINYALPMLDAVQAGRVYHSPYVVAGTGNQQMVHVTWADSYNEDTYCATNQRVSYPANALMLVSVFQFSGMSDGEQVLSVWWLDDEFLAGNVINWAQGPRGDCTAFTLHNFGQPLPQGQYVLEVYAGEDLQLVGVAETVIGATTVVDGPGSGVTVRGIVVDADSGQPIPGAVIFILYPDVDLDAWLADPQEADVLAFAEADNRGEFILPVSLQRGVTYPGIVGFSGYRPSDGYLTILDDDPDTIDLRLELSK